MDTRARRTIRETWRYRETMHMWVWLIAVTVPAGSMTTRERMSLRVQRVMMLGPKMHFVMLTKRILCRGTGLALVWPPFLSKHVMPGDVVLLSAGSLIPADGVVLEANDLFVNQAVLTGEVYPVEKKPGCVAAGASLMNRINCVFMGTSVRSGTARVLIVHTARATVFGQIAERLRLRAPETEFERGVQHFGYQREVSPVERSGFPRTGCGHKTH